MLYLNFQTWSPLKMYVMLESSFVKPASEEISSFFQIGIRICRFLKSLCFFTMYTIHPATFFHENKPIFDSNKPFILKYFFQFFFHRTVLLFLRPRSALSSWFHQNTKCIMYNDKPYFLKFKFPVLL